MDEKISFFKSKSACEFFVHIGLGANMRHENMSECGY